MRKKEREIKLMGGVGGMVELGETLNNACVREASEEINVKLDPLKIHLLDLKETPFFNDRAHAIHFIYATTLDEEEKIELNDESEDYGLFELDNLPERTLDPKEDIVKWSEIAKKRLQ